MINVYLDRNVNVRKVRALTCATIGEIVINFMQWPLEGKTSRIKEYGLPAGEILWNDLDHVTWNDLDFCTWDDFQPTTKYGLIVEIVGKENRKDCIHFDIAVKNGCSFYLTSDNDFLRKRDELFDLSNIRIYDPENMKDMQSFLKEIASLAAKPIT